jgi:PAS domain S-box-containing protein
VLVVDDTPDDADLVALELEHGGYHVTCERVDTPETLAAALAHRAWDLVIADHRMPHFSAPEALRIVQQANVDLPFIIVSGAIDEELAVAAMKAGAHDYITKDRLARLVPAVERELREAHNRRERRGAAAALQASEARYRALVENANDIVYTHDLLGTFTSFNAAAERLLGYRPDQPGTVNVADIVVPEHLELALSTTQRQLAGDTPPPYELDIHAADGHRVTVEVSTRLIYRDGQPVEVHGIARDVTERKRAQQRAAVLLEVAKDISGTLDVDQLLERVQPRIADALRCDRVATYYLDPEAGVIRLRAQHGTPAHLVPDAQRITFSVDDPITHELRRGQTVVCNGGDVHPWLSADLIAHFGLRATVIAPLCVSGHDLGAIVAIHTTEARFDEADVALAEGIARQLSVALEAAELYRTQRDEAEIANALVQASRELIAEHDSRVLLDHLCRLTATLLRCDYAHALLVGDKGEWDLLAACGHSADQAEALRAVKLPSKVLRPILARLAHADATQTALVESANPAIVQIAEQFELGRMLFMPLRRGDEIVGLQTACYRDRHRTFVPRQERIATGIAHVASLALANAHLVERLQRADRLKSEFVATMSHELRTPLNIMMGYNELLLEGVFGELNADQTDSLQRIWKSSEQLLDLINATLDLSRLEAGRMPLDLATVSFRQVVGQVESDTRDLQDKPGVRVLWHLPADLPLIVTDPSKLRVVLKNLVVNAIKFTDAGSVTIRASREAGGVVVSVSDTGVGIPADTLPIIFEPFRQGDGSATRRFGGVGLGLHIVRRLLDAIGGTISVESAVDRGTTFRVWLPMNATGAVPAAEAA